MLEQNQELTTRTEAPIRNKYINQASNYDKFPIVAVTKNEEDCLQGWEEICSQFKKDLEKITSSRRILVLECYPGVFTTELKENLETHFQFSLFLDTVDLFLPESTLDELLGKYLGEHPVFGFMSDLEMSDFLDPAKVAKAKQRMASTEDTILIFGPGASLLVESWDILVYADMARWEIQQRMRRNVAANLGVNNQGAPFSEQYKRAYFVDWRVCDRLKKQLMNRWDYVLDTNIPGKPKMVTGENIREGLKLAASQPFRVVPFFDPGPWGGQWMKEICDLDRSKINFAWCFDCVPEENSLLLGFGNALVEIPSINLVFFQPAELLGEAVYQRFGAEFPIRFDFLDTMEGGNLSLQVHPLTEYIQEHFGMDYTQDESYYMLDAGENAFVYLGMKDTVNPQQMIEELEIAQNGGAPFNADKHVKKWAVKKHDHVLIPAGTVHCSGTDSMVLEISATPYIFTFKLWDWGRLGLDGKPRPISIDHGKEVIQWDRKEDWTKKELINAIELIDEGDGWREERTGLHALEFIETRRHWFLKKVMHHTNGTVNVLNLIEGREAIVESPDKAFESFVVHYAETFIIPAAVGAYTIRPYGESEGMECGTVKAFVRT